MKIMKTSIKLLVAAFAVFAMFAGSKMNANAQVHTGTGWSYDDVTKELTITADVTDGGYSTYNDDATKITIASGVTEIDDGTFANFGNVTNVSLPGTLTQISDRAFYGCDSLTSISIPSSVTVVKEDAFSFCSELKFLSVTATTELEVESFGGVELDRMDIYFNSTEHAVMNNIYLGIMNSTLNVVPGEGNGMYAHVPAAANLDAIDLFEYILEGDGTPVYIISYETSAPVVEEVEESIYTKDVKAFVADVKNAKAGDTLVFDKDYWFCLTQYMLDNLKEKGDVNVQVFFSLSGTFLLSYGVSLCHAQQFYK